MGDSSQKKETWSIFHNPQRAQQVSFKSVLSMKLSLSKSASQQFLQFINAWERGPSKSSQFQRLPEAIELFVSWVLGSFLKCRCFNLGEKFYPTKPSVCFSISALPNCHLKRLRFNCELWVIAIVSYTVTDHVWFNGLIWESDKSCSFFFLRLKER